MRTPGMTGKRALLASGIAILGLSLCSCSSAGKIIGFFKFWDSDRPKVGVSSQDVERMGFQVRPVKGNAEAHYNLGCYYQERDRHREAIEEFQKAVSIDPTNVKALNRLGISYDEVREFPRAVAAYQAAIGVDPQADYTWNNLAHSYRLQGRFEESIASFKKALAINSTSTRIHNNLGLVYVMMGKTELARKEFEQAIALANPGRPGEQAGNKEQQPKAVKATLNEDVKLTKNPSGNAELAQPNATPVAPVARNEKPAERVAAAPVTSTSPSRPAPTLSSVKRVVDVKKTVEAEKASVETVQAKVKKPVEIKKTTKAAEAKKPAEVKAVKIAAIKKPAVVKKTAAKAASVRNVGTTVAKPISLVLQKRRVVPENRGVESMYNSDGFYAELAKSIVRVRPVVLTPVRGWTSYPATKIWL